jgi:hypothetical protein
LRHSCYCLLHSWALRTPSAQSEIINKVPGRLPFSQIPCKGNIKAISKLPMAQCRQSEADSDAPPDREYYKRSYSHCYERNQHSLKVLLIPVVR